jgi:hypothetical protein
MHSFFLRSADNVADDPTRDREPRAPVSLEPSWFQEIQSGDFRAFDQTYPDDIQSFGPFRLSEHSKFVLDDSASTFLGTLPRRWFRFSSEVLGKYKFIRGGA